MLSGLVRSRALVAAASFAALASAMGALAWTGCSSPDVAIFIPGPQSTPSITITQVGPDTHPYAAGAHCIPIGTDPDAEIPIVITPSGIFLRPVGIFSPPILDDAGMLALDTNGNALDAGGTDGPCGFFSQCGHFLLYVREACEGDAGVSDATSADGGESCDSSAHNVYNNSGSALVLPFLLRKLASRESTFVLTVQFVGDNGSWILHNGVPTPLQQEVTITTSETCPSQVDGGASSSSSASGSGGATSSSASGSGGAASSSGAGGAGGAGGAASSSGAGGAGGSGGSGGAGGAGG